MATTMPFAPGATATINATTTSASASVNANVTTLEVQNAGSAAAFIRVGTGAQTAVATDYPILAGQSKLITKAIGADTVAAITGTGTTTIYVTSGEGI